MDRPRHMAIASPTPARIIIIEDEPLIALDLQDLLVDAGFEIVGVAGKLENALALIESTVFDAAIVDANLAGVSSSPAATALTARGRPFILLSGYSVKQQFAAFPGGHFIQKPGRPAQLIQTLNRIISGN
jgi:DNA-binding NarL/FixJ family response regulator